MKIIQHGNPEKLKRIAAIKTFCCINCDCIFEAAWNEYTEITTRKGKSIITCDCPECHLIAHEKGGDDA